MIEYPWAAGRHEDLMRPESIVTAESHQSAATVNVKGDLTMMAVLQAITLADQLPQHIRALCIDLRGARSEDSHVLRALETGLLNWRSYRNGLTRVMLPGPMDASVVALRFPHQRWGLRHD